MYTCNWLCRYIKYKMYTSNFDGFEYVANKSREKTRKLFNDKYLRSMFSWDTTFLFSPSEIFNEEVLFFFVFLLNLAFAFRKEDKDSNILIILSNNIYCNWIDDKFVNSTILSLFSVKTPRMEWRNTDCVTYGFEVNKSRISHYCGYWWMELWCR